LIRASINLRKEILSKKMDHRVKPGDDDLNWCDGKYNPVLLAALQTLRITH